MSSNKQYIGSGKPTQHDGVKVTLKIDEAKAHFYTTDKGTFLTFVVAKKETTDKYGKSHTAFILPREEKGTATSQVSEPQGVPEGEVVKENGRKLRKVSKAKADALRAGAQA